MLYFNTLYTNIRIFAIDILANLTFDYMSRRAVKNKKSPGANLRNKVVSGRFACCCTF